MFSGYNKSQTEADGVRWLTVIIAITNIRESDGRKECGKAGPYQNTSAFWQVLLDQEKLVSERSSGDFVIISAEFGRVHLEPVWSAWGGPSFYQAPIECGPLDLYKKVETEESCKTLCRGCEGGGGEIKEGKGH